MHLPRLALYALLALLLTDLILALVLSFFPHPNAITIVPGAKHPGRVQMEAIANADWADALEREFDASKQMAYEPYTGHSRQPYRGTLIRIGRDGLREVPASASLPADADEVWVLGGSTVWGTGVPDTWTIPNLMATALIADARPLRVRNLAESGYVTSQSLIRLAERLRRAPRPPVAVVWLDGANDVISGLQNDAAGLPQNLDHRVFEFNSVHRGEALLRVLAFHLPGVRALIRKLRPVPTDLPELADRLAVSYRAHLEQLDALAAHYGFVTVVGWQPVLFSKQTLSTTEQQAHDASSRLHRELALATLAATEPVLAARADSVASARLYDQTSAALYLDFCHFGAQGHQRLAELLVEALKRRLDQSDRMLDPAAISAR